MGYPVEARRDRSPYDECGPEEHFTSCAWRPRVHEALTTACRHAAATDSRALLGFIARPAHLQPDDDTWVEMAARVLCRRDGDVVDVCPAGVLVVVAGLTHPADGEALVHRVVRRLGWGEAAAVGLALFPIHADRVTALVASASASLRRALGDLVPSSIGQPVGHPEAGPSNRLSIGPVAVPPDGARWRSHAAVTAASDS